MHSRQFFRQARLCGRRRTRSWYSILPGSIVATYMDEFLSFPIRRRVWNRLVQLQDMFFFQSFAGVIILSGNTTTVCWVVKFEKTTDYHTDWHLETSQKRNQLKDESKRFLKQIGIWNWTIKRKLNLSICISHVCVSLYFTILLSKTHLDISYPSALQFWHVWIYISLESAKCK